MSSEQDRIRELAERVARRLETAKAEQAGTSERLRDAAAPDEIIALRAKLAEMQRRLAHLESHLAHDEDCEWDARGSGAQSLRAEGARRHGAQTTAATPTRSTWLSGTYLPVAAHPSEEKFAGIGEAVSELVDFFESEKTCAVEPGGKPCDHCGMCSSRGF